jgi:hypothetical protein
VACENVLKIAFIQNWIYSKRLDITPDMDLLAKKIHYTRLNTINKLEIIFARKRSSMIDNCIRKSRKIGSGHFHAFFDFMLNLLLPVD